MSTRIISIDGLDGAGKSTLAESAKAWFTQKDLNFFDTTAWSKQHHRLPTLEDVGEADVLLTAEPTHVGIGAAIRTIILPPGSTYSAQQCAAAYALDRDVLYQQLIHPFIVAKPNGWILQERGLIASLAYQPLQSLRNRDSDPLTTEQVLALPGNQTALRHVPTLFFFVDIDAELAQQRLHGRRGHIAEDIFDDQSFQTALRERYQLPEVTNPWTSRGTRIITLDGSQTKEQITQAMYKYLDELTVN